MNATNDDAFEALQRFAAVWHGKYAQRASAGGGKPPSLTVRAGSDAAVLSEPQLGMAVAEYMRMREETEALRSELLKAFGARDAHRRRQIEAERALILMLTRLGGNVEFTPAELAAVDYSGSFVSLRSPVTGSERLAFVTARQADAAAQQSAPSEGDPDA